MTPLRAAGHADQIERRAVREGVGRHQTEAAIARHRRARFGDDVDCRSGKPRQHLQRTGEVELRQIREDHKTDVERGHAWSPFVLKRDRNSVGEAAIVRAKARSMRRSEPNPQATAMVSTLSSVSSNRRRARSVRTRSTKSAGLMFKPARNRRLSERCDTPASAAKDIGAPVGARLRGHLLGELLELCCCRPTARPARRRTGFARPAGCERRRAAAQSRARPCGRDRPRSSPAPDPFRRSRLQRSRRRRSSIWMASPSTTHRGTKSLQRIDLAPMRGRAPAVERSGSREEERAAAHRCDARHSADRAATRCLSTDPRASSCRMPGSPPTVISVSVRARRRLVICA